MAEPKDKTPKNPAPSKQEPAAAPKLGAENVVSNPVPVPPSIPPVAPAKHSRTTADIPEPEYVPDFKVADLPDARHRAAVGLNIRSVVIKPGEDPNAAIDRCLDIKEIKERILRSSMVEQLSKRHALMLAIWSDGKTPRWFPTDMPSEKYALIDGNRRTITLKDLLALYPTGTKVKVKVQGPRGGEDEVEVSKRFDTCPVEIYRDLTEPQFRALQASTFDRKNLQKGDIVRIGVEAVRRNPRITEASIRQIIGETQFKAYYAGVNPHTGCQVVRRAGLCPVDVGNAWISRLNRESGAIHPTDKELEDLVPIWKAEYGDFQSGGFKRGTLASSIPQINPGLTTDQIQNLIDSYNSSVPPAKQVKSEFVLKWREIKAQGKQGPKAGTAASQAGIKDMEAGFNQTPVLLELFQYLRGGPGMNIAKDEVLDNARDMELLLQNTSTACMTPGAKSEECMLDFLKGYKALMAKLGAQRKKVEDSLAALAAGVKPAEEKPNVEADPDPVS